MEWPTRDDILTRMMAEARGNAIRLEHSMTPSFSLSFKKDNTYNAYCFNCNMVCVVAPDRAGISGDMMVFRCDGRKI
jgi:hypothetical protein